MGVKKTLARLQESFYWPNMLIVVTEFVRSALLVNRRNMLLNDQAVCSNHYHYLIASGKIFPWISSMVCLCQKGSQSYLWW